MEYFKSLSVLKKAMFFVSWLLFIFEFVCLYILESFFSWAFVEGFSILNLYYLMLPLFFISISVYSIIKEKVNYFVLILLFLLVLSFPNIKDIFTVWFFYLFDKSGYSGF